MHHFKNHARYILTFSIYYVIICLEKGIGGIFLLEYITDRVDDFDIKSFVNELADASKSLGILEAKITGLMLSP